MADEGKGCAVILGIIAGIVAVGVVVMGIAYIGVSLVIAIDFVARSFTWLGVESPMVGWLILGLITGAFVGLVMGLKRAIRSPGWPVYTGVAALGVLVFLGAFYANPVDTTQNSQASAITTQATPCSSSSVYSTLAKYNWKAQINNALADLQIFYRNGKWLGQITHSGVKEDLVVEVNNDCSFVLRGTSYKRLSGRGTFSLDTFSGRLSSNSRSITGTYTNNANNKGVWQATAK